MFTLCTAAFIKSQRISRVEQILERAVVEMLVWREVGIVLDVGIDANPG